MANKPTPREYADITQVINEIAEEINTILKSRKKEKYFEGIVLLYSFIENLLKWLVFLRALWRKAEKELTKEEVSVLRSFHRKLGFHDALNIAFSIGLIDYKLYERIDAVRQERNSVVHQFWVYTHRGNLLVLRKKLEKLAGVANRLVEVFNQLTKKVGIEEIYDIFL